MPIWYPYVHGIATECSKYAPHYLDAACGAVHSWDLRAVQCIAGMSTLSALESYLAAACVHCIAAMSNPSTLASTWPLPKPEVSSFEPSRPNSVLISNPNRMQLFDVMRRVQTLTFGLQQI